MNQQIIPAGYVENERGHLVPVADLKPIDFERDTLVKQLAGTAKVLSEQLAKFKAGAFGDIEALVEMSASEHGAKPGKLKGNLTLYSYDGRLKVQRSNHDHIVFDEKLLAAKALIDECLQEWSKGAHPGLVAIVNDAFRTDNNGDLRTARVLALRRHNIDDDRWKRAMDAIGDALHVASSTTYIRIYERVGKGNKYRMIPLDLAAV